MCCAEAMNTVPFIKVGLTHDKRSLTTKNFLVCSVGDKIRYHSERFRVLQCDRVTKRIPKAKVAIDRRGRLGQSLACFASRLMRLVFLRCIFADNFERECVQYLTAAG